MTLRLYDYWRSGAGHRVRIALGLKGLAFERVAVDLRAGAQREEAFKALNPQGFVPALEIAPGVILTQSLAILEWLEETCPDPPLLPAEPRARASVRALAAAVACDVHPLGNARVLAYLRDAQGQTDAAIAAWATRWITDGFAALERLLADAPQDGPQDGPWCWGARPTIADCVVAPQLFAATSRYGVDLSPYPRLARVNAAAEADPIFAAAHPAAQLDAPRATG